MLSVVSFSRPFYSLWTSFILLLYFFFSFDYRFCLFPLHLSMYFPTSGWKINSVLSVSSCVTSYSLQWILGINSISVVLVLPVFILILSMDALRLHCETFFSSLYTFKYCIFSLLSILVDAQISGLKPIELVHDSTGEKPKFPKPFVGFYLTKHNFVPSF